jgi:hypothetical protein
MIRLLSRGTIELMNQCFWRGVHPAPAAQLPNYPSHSQPWKTGWRGASKGSDSLVRLDISESCYSAVASSCSAEYQAPNPCALEEPAGNVSQLAIQHPSQQAYQGEQHKSLRIPTFRSFLASFACLLAPATWDIESSLSEGRFRLG